MCKSSMNIVFQLILNANCNLIRYQNGAEAGLSKGLSRKVKSLLSVEEMDGVVAVTNAPLVKCSALNKNELFENGP